LKSLNLSFSKVLLYFLPEPVRLFLVRDRFRECMFVCKGNFYFFNRTNGPYFERSANDILLFSIFFFETF